MKLRSRVLPYIGHNRGRLFSNKSTDLHNLEWKFIFSKGEGKPAKVLCEKQTRAAPPEAMAMRPERIRGKRQPSGPCSHGAQ